MKLIQTEKGFVVRGSLKGINELLNEFHQEGTTEEVKEYYVEAKKKSKITELEALFKGGAWGDSSWATISNTNVTVLAPDACYFLLHRYDSILKLLGKHNARLKFKDAKDKHMRLRIERQDKSKEKDIENALDNECKSAMSGNKSISMKVDSLKHPGHFLAQVMQKLQLDIVLLIK